MFLFFIRADLPFTTFPPIPTTSIPIPSVSPTVSPTFSPTFSPTPLPTLLPTLSPTFPPLSTPLPTSLPVSSSLSPFYLLLCLFLFFILLFFYTFILYYHRNKNERGLVIKTCMICLQYGSLVWVFIESKRWEFLFMFLLHIGVNAVLTIYLFYVASWQTGGDELFLEPFSSVYLLLFILNIENIFFILPSTGEIVFMAKLLSNTIQGIFSLIQMIMIWILLPFLTSWAFMIHLILCVINILGIFISKWLKY